jgi:Ca2+-binding EF-hand superfamily protein
MGLLSLGMATLPRVAPAQEHRAQDLPNPMQAARLLQEVGRTMFIAADVNHDGLLSQKEAIDANNALVGGLFFQADRDGNGVVTQEEARAVQDNYLSQNPWLKYIVESLLAQQRNPQSNAQLDPIQSFTALLDSNNDKQIQASEVRELVQTTTQSIFAAADTNRDGKMSPSEINAAVAGGARAIAQFAFQMADTDNNGSLSRAEYDKAIMEPANVVFQVADLDHNGQISQQEAEQTERTIISQIRMFQLPEPSNSLTNLIQSGKTPEEAAKVPTFATPSPAQVRQQFNLSEPAQRR